MTVRFFEYRDLNVFTLTLSHWPYPVHKHNHYEIIAVEAGCGHHVVNGIRLPYAKGDVFFLRPDDEHAFEIKKSARFTFVKFTELLLTERLEGLSGRKWKSAFRQLLSNPNRGGQSLAENDADRSNFADLMGLLVYEYTRSHLYSRQIVLELFGVLLLCVGRCLHAHDSPTTTPDKDTDLVQRISAYLRNHLLDRRKTTIVRLAEEFNLSPNYVSLFYKKHTGDSIQQFIMKSKLKMGQQLLLHSKYTISEIAHQLEFTDVSHFSKMFKKYSSKTPGAFRSSAPSGPNPLSTPHDERDCGPASASHTDTAQDQKTLSKAL